MTKPFKFSSNLMVFLCSALLCFLSFPALSSGKLPI